MPQRLDFDCLYRSASEAAQVGGDFYDLFEVAPGRIAILIGAAFSDIVDNGWKAHNICYRLVWQGVIVLKKLSWHPFLFAVHPILFLFALNVDRTPVSDTLKPLALTLLALVVAWLFSWFILRSGVKSAIITSLLFFLFFSYGRAYQLIAPPKLFKTPELTHKALVACWLAAILIAAIMLWRTRGNLEKWRILLNAIGAILVSLSLLTVVMYEFNQKDSGRLSAGHTVKVSGVRKADYPSIYYIILDGYGREDVLDTLYKFDNSAFINFLRQKGFYVASQSTSNYNNTSHSLPSSLNIEYLQKLLPDYSPDSYPDYAPLVRLTARPSLARLFRKYGLNFVVFDSDYSGVEIEKTDLFYHSRSSLTEFQNTLLSTTVLAAAVKPVPATTAFQFESKRQQLLWQFDHLPDMAKSERPFFAFVHILAPHPPFVFGANGQPIDPGGEFSMADGVSYFELEGTTKAGYIKRYRDQLSFVNKKTMRAIDEILARSNRPPIIVLQSDHGPASELNQFNVAETNLKERFSNLTAFYFPDGKYEQLYPSITPVNNFRVVLSLLRKPPLKLAIRRYINQQAIVV